MKKITCNIFIALFSMAILVAGCRKFDDPPAVFEEYENKVLMQRKVLVISIDGLPGAELKTIAPPTIEELRKTSKYTYDVLRGTVANDVASWTSMATGIGYNKHLTRTDDFLPTPKENSHDAPPVYRNVLDYILQYKAVKTGIVTPWVNLRNYFKVADINPIVGTDLQVKDSTIKILNEVPSLGTLFVNFREVLAAGATAGYVASSTTFKNSVLKTDEYIADILKALKARKTYASEDWLIVLTTSHGGANNDPKPGFLIASHKDLKMEELKPSYNSVLFNPTSVTAEVANDNGLYDANDTKDFTVQMETKFNTLVQWPGFLSKSTDMSVNTFTGWLWMQSNNTWAVVFGGSANGGTGKNQIAAGAGVADGNWHTLTMVVKTTGTTARTVTTYIDGVQSGAGSILANKSISVNNGLRIGHRRVDGDKNLSLYAANLCYFDSALDAATIKANIGLKDITKHPNYANLIGFWPGNDRSGAILENKVAGGYNMNITGSYIWSDLGVNVPPSVQPIAGKAVTVTNGSIAALTMYWMKINILPAFGIEGAPVLNQFELEFLK